MLSPGSYHERVPKETVENLRFRKHVLDRCETNPRYRQAVLEMCRDDLLFYVNTFVWQFNPDRLNDEVGPFISWPYQDNGFSVMISALADQQDLCIEKSRNMGATWMCLMFQDWYCKTHKNKDVGVISRDADAVNDGTMSTLMPKLDFISTHQPRWLTGDIGRWEKRLLRKYERTNSTIQGEAATGKAFVSGRLGMLFVDEFSQISDGYTVQKRTHDVTKCRFFNFTHVGAGGHAYDLSVRPDIRKLVMHWSEHPYKNEGLYRYDPDKGRVVALDTSYHFPVDYKFVADGAPNGGPYPGVRGVWYDEQCRRRSDSKAVAEDLDIDPAGSTYQFFDPIKVADHKRQFAYEPRQYELVYDAASAEPVCLREAPGGFLRLWFAPDAEGRPPKARYAVGCDVATGTGGPTATPSTATVLNAWTGEKVAEYANARIYPYDFARQMVALCRLFRDLDGDGAVLNWEVQGGPGITFGNIVKEMGYLRLYYMPDGHSGRRSLMPGWSNAKHDSLAIALRDYAPALYAGHFINRSVLALDECLQFNFRPGGKVEHKTFATGIKDDPSGAQANHGDRTVADAVAWMAMKDGYAARMKGHTEPEPDYPFLSLGWRKAQREDRAGMDWLDRGRRLSGRAGVTVWSASDSPPDSNWRGAS